MNHPLYRKIYEKQAEFYRRHAWAKKALWLLNHAFTLLIAAGYFSLLIVLAAVKAWRAVIFSCALPLTAYICVTLVRKLFRRSRPYEENGAGISPLFMKKDGAGKSFPSRHLASAFVIATVVLPHAVWAACVLYAFGLGLGYIRFAAGLHYPSDLVCGALLGAGIGALIFLVL